MSAQWPLVVKRLLTLLPTLSGWEQVTVFDGPIVTGDVPNAYIEVGNGNNGNAGDYSQTQAPDGFRIIEAGNVVCRLVCQSGSVNENSALRIAVFALADAFEAQFRADRTIGGVLAPGSTIGTTVTVAPIVNGEGSAQVLDLTIDYYTIT